MSRNLRGSKKEGKKAGRSNKHGSDRRGPEADKPFPLDASGHTIAYEGSYDDAYEESLAQAQTGMRATAAQDEEDLFQQQLQAATNQSRVATRSYPYRGGRGESSTMPPEQPQADDAGFDEENINLTYVPGAGMYVNQFQGSEYATEEDYQAAGVGGGDYSNTNTYSVPAETDGGAAPELSTSLTEYNDEDPAATMLVSFARKSGGNKTVAAYLDRACHVENLISHDLVHELGKQDDRQASTRAGAMVASGFGKVRLHGPKITIQWKMVESDGKTKGKIQETEFFIFKSKSSPNFEYDVSFRLPWNAPGECLLQRHTKKDTRRQIRRRSELTKLRSRH